MAAPVSSVYDVLDCVRNKVEEICVEEELSPLLVWLVLRQQADYQLLLLQDSNE